MKLSTQDQEAIRKVTGAIVLNRRDVVEGGVQVMKLLFEHQWATDEEKRLAAVFSLWASKQIMNEVFAGKFR